jgi:hypothetical protein
MELLTLVLVMHQRAVGGWGQGTIVDLIGTKVRPEIIEDNGDEQESPSCRPDGHNSLRIPLQTLREIETVVEVGREPIGVTEKREENFEFKLFSNGAEVDWWELAMVEKGFEPRGLGVIEQFDESQTGERVMLIVFLRSEERESDDVDPMDDMEHGDEEDEVTREIHGKKKLWCLEIGVSCAIHGDEDTCEPWGRLVKVGEMENLCSSTPCISAASFFGKHMSDQWRVQEGECRTQRD